MAKFSELKNAAIDAARRYRIDGSYRATDGHVVCVVDVSHCGVVDSVKYVLVSTLKDFFGATVTESMFNAKLQRRIHN